MDILEKIWALIKSKEPINIALAVELAEGQALDLAYHKLLPLYDRLFPLQKGKTKKEKLIHLFGIEGLSLNEQIPTNLDQLPNLESLILDGTNLQKFQFQKLRTSKNLRLIKLVELKQSGLGQHLYKIPKLEVLNIIYSRIGYLHPDIGKIKSLKALTIQQTDLKELPEELLELKKLKVLSIQQAEINLSFLDIIAQMPQLRILRLSKKLVKKTERERLQRALPNCRISYN